MGAIKKHSREQHATEICLGEASLVWGHKWLMLDAYLRTRGPDANDYPCGTSGLRQLEGPVRHSTEATGTTPSALSKIWPSGMQGGARTEVGFIRQAV